jgi:non-homologous end joining protein Ku
VSLLDREVRPAFGNRRPLLRKSLLSHSGGSGRPRFAVIRDAMASKKMVGIGRVVLQKPERPILLEAFGKGIRGMTLR